MGRSSADAQPSKQVLIGSPGTSAYSEVGLFPRGTEASIDLMYKNTLSPALTIQTMADAHLPNSHPDVTPDWQPYDFPRTSLLEGIKVQLIEGSEGQRYAGSVPQVWGAVAGRRLAAHGGFCATTLMTTARQYIRDKYEHLAQVEPLNMFVEYLAPLPVGPYQVALETLHLGKRGSTIQARLISNEEEKDHTCTVGIIRFGILKDEGHTENIHPPVGPLPDRVNECMRWTDALYFFFNPPTGSVRTYVPNDKGTPFWSEKYGGQNSRYQWDKLDNGEKFQLEHITMLADLVPAIPANYAEEGLMVGARFRIPTTAIHIMFHSEVKDEEWLLTKSTMNRLHAGRFDMNIQIINDAGEIVASCVHLCSVIPQGKSGQITGKL
ncbi:thioesterase-like superfamily domain-containing [Fusarium albosuccineum]|uniref:Thioesterase-like superfamily domain-containing n=1 Tax=Fusarium albosuccineum TaxID=1237068 RepID=A0A8H4L4X5_9HYPO|nr:thioesterase-like superfamily domain-containing [Fusarium albosuccineum]